MKIFNGKLLFVVIIFLLIFSFILYINFIHEQYFAKLPIELKVIVLTLKGYYADGFYNGDVNTIDFKKLKVGDIIIVGNPKSVYGTYTHAALYIGNGLTVDGNIGEGIRYVPVEHYKYYSYGKILRIMTSDDIKIKACINIEENVGSVFFLLAPIQNENLTYCTKMIWTSFKKAGIELFKPNRIIVPDDFLKSKFVYEVK
ncbi:hypothetical protein ACAG39_07705 [Caldicellulosiruptoraceae bacterium PP1]